jgi:hypothetical protein
LAEDIARKKIGERKTQRLIITQESYKPNPAETLSSPKWICFLSPGFS